MVVLQTPKTTQETAMNHGTKITGLPAVTANLLRDGGCLIDNLFADLWKHVGMKARMNRIRKHGVRTQYCSDSLDLQIAVAMIAV